MDILSFVGSFVETINRASRRKRKGEKERNARKRGKERRDDDDDDDRLVATVAGNAAFIPIRRYDMPKRSPHTYLHMLRYNNGISLTRVSWLDASCGGRAIQAARLAAKHDTHAVGFLMDRIFRESH